MAKKQKAVGFEGSNSSVDMAGIERTLALRADGQPARPGFGRLVSTVGTLEDIERKLDDGWEILWCQMSKIMPGKGNKYDE